MHARAHALHAGPSLSGPAVPGGSRPSPGAAFPDALLTRRTSLCPGLRSTRLSSCGISEISGTERTALTRKADSQVSALQIRT